MRGSNITVVRAHGALLLVCGNLLLGCLPGPKDSVAENDPLPETITFTEHIAPIIWQNCTPCHRPGQAGPFNLITYEDVRRKAKTIKLVTGRRDMPPWPADTGYTHFLGERVLSERAIALIAKWVDSGMADGDRSRLPEPPRFPEGSLLGEPDLVVWLPDTFRIPGDGRDHFMITKAPFELERDTFLRAIEFVPGNRRQVHHVNGALINYEDGAKADVREGGGYIDAEVRAGVDAFSALMLANDDGSWPPLTPSVVNYLPGLSPVLLPDGIGGIHLARKGAFLLNSIHYGPSARDTTDRSRFNLWFAPEAPERPLQEIAMGSNHTAVEPPLHLMPGEIATFHSSHLVEKDISVISVNPHMHLLGKTFLAYAVTQEGDTLPLVRINDWDFRWQYAYTFPHMVVLRRGAVIHVYGSFDNTAQNPDQPFDPPREVSGTDSRFMRTTDEMFQFFLTCVDHRPGDEHIVLGPETRR